MKVDTYNVSMSIGEYKQNRTVTALQEFVSPFGAMYPDIPVKSSRTLDFTCSISSNIFMPTIQNYKFKLTNLPTYTNKPFIW